MPTYSFEINFGACHSPGMGERDAGELQHLIVGGSDLTICVDLREEWERESQSTWCNLLIKGVLCYSSLLRPDTSVCIGGDRTLNLELELDTFPF